MGSVDVVIGEVLGVHIRDEFIMPDGKVDILRIRPLARLGYYDYSCVDSVFEMVIPGQDEEVRIGMEGDAKKLR
jgi:flavin reductase (DIM6/NTAB) family NADH-FMN oxidoreductase RutF